VIDLESEQSPVRNQGDRGTCTGFAVSGGHDWMGSTEEVRSAEDVIWAARQERPGASDGVSVQAALTGLAANEHASELAWPYGTPHWSEGRPGAASKAANRVALPPWRRLDAPSFDAIRDELAQKRAVVLTVGMVYEAWQLSQDVIDAKPGEKVPGRHAILVVGASEKGEQMEVLKVKNSWGRGWGSGGYALLSRDYLEAYGVCAHSIEGN
jgi:hypothetical protein